MITFADVEKAAGAVSPYIHRTPLVTSRSLGEMTGARVSIKAENLQKTGSFKVRGAFSKLLSIPAGDVVAASMGNHAQAVAYAAGVLGRKATIVMPGTVSIVKEEATRGYGAEVVISGRNLTEAFAHARSLPGKTFVHAFDDELVMAGQGTIGIEILEDMRDVDAVIVPVGGGGLISGIALAVKSLSPSTRVIGVQARAATSARDFFRTHEITTKEPVGTIADGIAVGRVGEKTAEVLGRFVDDILLVGEDAIAHAVLLLLERKKLLVEGAGAVPLACLLEHGRSFRGKGVVLVASGGNMDMALMDRILRRGLAACGRMFVVDVIVDDRPGVLQEVGAIILAERGNIVDVASDRFSADLPVGKTRLRLTVEARGLSHGEIMKDRLAACGFSVSGRDR